MFQPSYASDFNRKLSWLKARMDNGGSFYFALLYARLLWGFYEDKKIEDPAKDPRVTAGAVMLYVVELLQIDGARCEDRTASGARVHQVLIGDGATFAFLRQLPEEWKAKAVDTAIAIEQKTSPLRTDDDLLCRGGLAAMQAGGTQKEVPSRPGTIGKTIEVTPPADWSPKFVAPDVYLPKQAEARAKMRETLLTIVQPLPSPKR